MKPYTFPLAIVGFVGFVAMTPVAMYFINEYAPDLPSETQFIAALAFPAMALLFLASWVQPGSG